MILLLKVKQMFLKSFYDNTTEVFYDIINIVVILAPSREFFSANCDQFPLTFTE